jgi:hypothetical protein
VDPPVFVERGSVSVDDGFDKELLEYFGRVSPRGCRGRMIVERGLVSVDDGFDKELLEYFGRVSPRLQRWRKNDRRAVSLPRA